MHKYWEIGKDGRKIQHQDGAEVTADAGRGNRGDGGEVDCMPSQEGSRLLRLPYSTKTGKDNVSEMTSLGLGFGYRSGNVVDMHGDAEL